MDYFKREIKKEEVLAHMGSIQQIAGVQRATLEEGKGKGSSLIRVRNGRGLDFTLVPDRSLDIFDATYKGIPLAWISTNGLVSNSHYDKREAGWLGSFGGGLLVTCGLRNVGPPCTTDKEHFGLHGRISSTPAIHVNTRSYWKEDNYFIEVSGEIRETNVFGENLVCYRTIVVSTLDNHIHIHDRVINEGFREEYLALLYHFNWGSPLLSEHSELLFNPIQTKVRDSKAPAHSWNQLSPPTAGVEEVVYLHEMKGENGNQASYILRNSALGLGVKVTWNCDQLPYLTQWKMMGQGEYVLGLEPGNCFPLGRVHEMDNTRMDRLLSFEEKNINLSIKLFDNQVNSPLDP